MYILSHLNIRYISTNKSINYLTDDIVTIHLPLNVSLINMYPMFLGLKPLRTNWLSTLYLTNDCENTLQNNKTRLMSLNINFFKKLIFLDFKYREEFKGFSNNYNVSVWFFLRHFFG